MIVRVDDTMHCTHNTHNIGRRVPLIVAKASTDDTAEKIQAKATELLEVAQVW